MPTRIDQADLVKQSLSVANVTDCPVTGHRGSDHEVLCRPYRPFQSEQPERPLPKYLGRAHPT